MSKRGNGEGTIYRRADGTWSGQISVYVGGRRCRPTVYGATQREVQDKLKTLRRDAEHGRPVVGRKPTLSE